MSDLALRGVRKSFGTVETIKGVDLDIRSGEFVVFVGPSGCGKSTLLRMISGLESVSGGRIAIDGRDVTALAPAERGVAMVFQSYALYPHMTVRENMSFGLRMNGVPRDEVEARVAEAARILQIEALRDRKPRQLSGGQRQRVAIGRAIVRNPKVFLFDEPLSNLDAGLRVQMRVEIAKLHQELGATMVYVTHDQVEAMTLADRIVVLNGGRVEQVGRPLDLYERPANRFVAGFLGQPTMNFVPARLSGGSAERLALELADGARIAAFVRADVALVAGARLMVGVRPDAVHIVAPGNGTIDGRVEVVERLGDETVVHIRTAVAADLVVAKLDRRSDLKSGERCGLVWDEEQLHVFGDAGEQLRF